MSFGPVEAIVIVVVVLVVFGAGRLAGVGGALGKGLREFRQEAKAPLDEEDSDGERVDASTSNVSSDESKDSKS